MDNKKLIIKKNEEVNDEILDKVLKFDRTIFPEDEDYSFPDGYFRKLYKDFKEGMFVLLEDNEVKGYVNLIFISEEGKDEFLKNREYLKLENIGFNNGDNIVYLYNLLLHEDLRDTGIIKLLIKEVCIWLNEKIKNGKKIKFFFSEAVTEDGIKTLKAMDLLPFDVNDKEMGIYYSKDNLNNFISKMI